MFRSTRKLLTNRYPPTFFAGGNKPVGYESMAERKPKSMFFKDLGMGFALIALVYFAVDNYQTRLMLQQKAFEGAMEQQKSLALAQMTFNNARKKREMQMLNERKNYQKREMKMALHIGLLRKQLLENGIKPLDIDQAVSEFEKNVKMENSLSNITGTALWVVDNSEIKSYLPSAHEYDQNR